MPSHVFASDNAAPAHPSVIAAIAEANSGAAASYGNDDVTRRAAEAIKATFDSPDAEVLFALTGTAANVIALASAVRPWQEILCSDIAHSLVDEAGGPVRLSGASVTPLPSDNGLIDPARLDTAVTRRGPVHHSQPRVVTITQSTENGRVWTPQAVKDFVEHAHDLDLLVHVDGSRIANAIAALGTSPADVVGDADIITVGGTKNGMLMGDAVLVRRPELFDGISFVQKQIGQLASKQRFVAAQFEAILRDGLWLRTATHANRLAARLSTGLRALGLRLAAPTEANEIFVDLEPDAYAAVSAEYAVHRPDPGLPTVRFVCSWATTEAEVDRVLGVLSSIST
ncbi:threonine aldolase [Mycolicibacterium conceptionense]|uniref:Threonine aldolase n=1 Tax=Mycolicibacterium senegalense TaxID=1796 RepID=A0ABR5FQC7_9MYCO|nr:threonine aldolase [Mycolicibacterium senegalense]KLO48987.1 threonine aldolase [Mycolicibacterium senegalense]OBJ93858.1 threonine aldolase [Mycolicibacterium conceptionense]OMB78700.1 threonine aldolase [Mycolicibacterium conceptionense]OMC01389.1 threonine aldolase [Mycolicibacterium conceptionense]